MSRSGYVDDYDCNNYSLDLYRQAVNNALQGRRGQAFLKEMLAAMDALPGKTLIKNDLQIGDGAVCAMGTVGKMRGLDLKKLDPEDYESIAKTFGIAPSMAREIMFENDENYFARSEETPEQRYERMKEWVKSKLRP